MSFLHLPRTDVELHYEEFGRGKLLLAVHGCSPDHRLMTGCLEPVFAQRLGWRRIYVDLPGMGKTPGRPDLASSDRILEVLLEFLDLAAPGESFAAAGESYGGYLVRGIVRERCENVLGALLLCPTVEQKKDRRALPKHLLSWEDADLEEYLTVDERREFASCTVVRTRWNWERFGREIFSGIRCADGEFLKRLTEERREFRAPADRAEPFWGPSLFIAGRQDGMVGYADLFPLLERYPRASLAVLDRAGHNLQIEQPRLFEELVAEWLFRMESGAC